jgi:hypothetical protein
VKQESTGSTLWNKSTRWLLFHSVLSVDTCFTVYYPLTLVSQCTTHWLLFHIVLPIDSCFTVLPVDSRFTVYYPLTLTVKQESMGSTIWNKSQRIVQCETRVNGKYTVKQESTGQCTTCWLMFHSVLPVDSCFTVYYPLTLVSQCTTRWLLFHSVLPVVVQCETRVNGKYNVKQESTGSTLWNKSQRVVHCEARVNG